MKKHPILSALFVLILIVVVSNYLSTQAFESSGQRLRAGSALSPTVAPSVSVPASSAPRESLDDILNRCAEQFIAEHPDHSRAEFNPDTLTFLLSFWQDNIADVVTLAISGDAAAVSAWSDICASVEESTLSVQHEFDKAGFGSVYVEIQMLNPDNKRLALLHAAQGSILYNVVSSSALLIGSETSFDSFGDPIVPSAPPTSHEPSLGEKNALRSAMSYLSHTPFSRDGLIHQLEFEGYTHDQAVYGVDNCGADWYEQAVKDAAQYLDLMSFSRVGLVRQLEFEGYTHDQAVYAVDQIGLY